MKLFLHFRFIDGGRLTGGRGRKAAFVSSNFDFRSRSRSFIYFIRWSERHARGAENNRAELPDFEEKFLSFTNSKSKRRILFLSFSFLLSFLNEAALKHSERISRVSLFRFGDRPNLHVEKNLDVSTFSKNNRVFALPTFFLFFFLQAERP